MAGARSLLEQAIAIEPNDARNLGACANAFFRSGDTAKARALLERAIIIEPNNVRNLGACAKSLLRSGDTARALSLFERAVTLAPNNVRTLNAYANALIKRGGDTNRALQLLDDAMELEPNNVFTLTNYANAMDRHGNTERALTMFGDAVRADPQNATTLARYANILARYDKTQEARGMLTRATQIASNSSISLFWIAKTFQVLREPEKAVETFENLLRSTSHDFDDFIVRLTLGQLYFQLGRTRSGLEQFDAMLEQAHDTDAAKLRIVRQIMIVSPHAEYANELLAQIADTSPRYEEAQDALGLNLDSDNHFRVFGQDATGRIPDRATLNRTLYHNINGHIAILKETLHEIQKDHNDPLLRNLVAEVSGVLQGIRDRRASVDDSLRFKAIGNYDYQDTLDLIANTAHDIVDFVGNEISTIRENLLLSIDDLPLSDPEQRRLYSMINDSITETLSALNDLKRINEGVHLRFAKVCP